MGLQGDAAGDVTGRGSAIIWGLVLGFEGPVCFPWVACAVTRADPGTSPLFVYPWTSRRHETSPWQQEQLSTWEAIVGKFYLMDV